MKRKLLCLSALLLSVGLSFAQTAFTPGNIVVSRMGNAAGPYSTTNAVYLDEYTPTGTFVRTLALPAASGSGIYQHYTGVEGAITRSSDGQYLTLVGYTVAAGSGSNFNTSTAVANPRCIALVKYDGTVSVKTPPVVAPVATGTGMVTANASPTPTTITLSAVSGTVAVGQYVYGNSIPNGVTVASISGTSPNLTITLSGSAGTTTSSSSSYLFMAAPTPSFANTQSPVAAITSNGNDIWLCSGESTLQYYNATTNALSNIATGYTSTTARTFGIYDGQLYGVNPFGLKLMTIGNGLPVTATSTAGLSYSTNPNSFAPGQPRNFCMVDASGTEPGVDLLYVVQSISGGGGGGTTNYGIVKYKKINGLWTVTGGYGTYTDNYYGLTAVADGSQVVLYSVRKAGAQGPGGELVKITDASSYVGGMTATETVLAAYNTGNNLGGAWRGVAFVPGAIVMPLELLSFNGKFNGSAVALQWQTANEVNVDHMVIERSADGQRYNAIGTVPAGKKEYAYTDQQPLTGIGYYRLKIVDKDGAFKYSKVIQLDKKAFTLSVYPNPVKDQVTITHVKTDEAPVAVIYTATGRQVLVQQLPKGTVQDKIDISRLAAGTYMLSYLLHDTRTTVTLHKQ
jgi:hypothetical protein